MSALPAGWAETPIGKCLAVRYGKAAPRNDEGVVPVVASSGTIRHTTEELVTGTTIIVGRKGGVGRVQLISGPAWPTDTTFYITVPGELSAKYLYYQMRALGLERLDRSTAVPSLQRQDLEAASLLMAPHPEQERIVAAIEQQFSRLDAGVAALEGVRRNLKRMSDSVLDDAVAGRLVPQIEPEGTGQHLLSTIRLPERRRRDSTPRSELTTRLPILPPSWATARWASVGLSQNGRAFPSSDYAPVGQRLLRPGNLDANGAVVWSRTNTRCMPEAYAREFPDYLVGPDEIVMNLTAQSLKDEFLGRVCMTGPGEDALLNQRIARLTPVGMHPRFVFWLFKSPVFRRFVDQLNTGSLIQHMFTSQLDEFVLPIPPLAEQRRIVARAEELISGLPLLELALGKALTRAVALRSSTLTAAFSGELVSQEPNEESAASLLARIATDRKKPSHGQRRSRSHKSESTLIKVSA